LVKHDAEADRQRADPGAQRDAFRYQPFYCEENAWWLCADPALGTGTRTVVFIANQTGLCPFAQQRAAVVGEIVWWDYHCVVLDGATRIWDLDTRLPLPLPARDWLDGTFPFARRLPAALQPRFRLVPAERYRRDFASDRSHMRRRDGRWQRPPPPWAPIGRGMNLPDYLDMAASTTGPVQVLDWEAMCRRCEAAERAR
jgi:hypothetical protein